MATEYLQNNAPLYSPVPANPLLLLQTKVLKAKTHMAGLGCAETPVLQSLIHCTAYVLKSHRFYLLRFQIFNHTCRAVKIDTVTKGEVLALTKF